MVDGDSAKRGSARSGPSLYRGRSLPPDLCPRGTGRIGASLGRVAPRPVESAPDLRLHRLPPASNGRTTTGSTISMTLFRSVMLAAFLAELGAGLLITLGLVKVCG